ncbi:NAD(P)H-quinone oxidoreductase [Verrucomicrobia bacterium SCGC AG-212-E04]|nr:NAD(P)H-quinone oxidoreductase [Verrucomicrobia bacterium SCGC AG-212-E04]
MRAIAITTPGGPEVLQLVDVPTPVAGPGEVLIRVAAAGVNRPDVFQRKGVYPPPPGASPLLGLEVAGTIAACGSDVTAWKPGDRVCALTPGGGYAEFCVTPAAHCLPIPTGWSDVEAASVPETAFTVWSNVFQRARLQPGESVLIHGGTSGIGVMAIQMARAMGSIPYATAGSAAKCQACVDLGAERAVNYREQDFGAEILAATDGRGVDVVLDMVGGAYFPKNLQVLATEGRLVQIATLQGAKVELDLRVMMAKRLILSGSTLRPQSNEAKAAIAMGLRQDAWPQLESRRVRPVLHEVFPLERAADAHRLMESGEHIGKIVLTVS